MDLNSLIDAIANLKGDRSLIAISGPPAGGKSTLSEALAAALNDRVPGSAFVVGQDAFHYDNAILEQRGQLARKGAPHTFDVAGFSALLDRLTAHPAMDVAVPVFDREIEASRNAATIVPASARWIIVEGNYLLLATPPWKDLGTRFDLTLSLEVPDQVLRQRLQDRWSNLDPAIAAEKIDGNDLPNAAFVRENSRPAEVVLTPDDL